MSDRTPNSANLRRILGSVVDAAEREDLSLETEIDKLALLLEDVKRQSDRVQAIADAMGQKIMNYRFAVHDGGRRQKRGANARSQRDKVLSISAVSKESATN